MFLSHTTEQLHDSIKAEDGHILAHLLYPYLPDVAASPTLARKLYTTCTTKRAKIGIFHLANCASSIINSMCYYSVFCFYFHRLSYDG